MVVFYVILAVVAVATVVAVSKIFPVNFTALVAFVLAAMLLPAPVYAIATSVAKADQQTFHEYWNGYEVAATFSTVACERDGSCANEYNCDSYVVWKTEFYTDSDGKSKSRRVSETKWHDCPYSTQETSYTVDTTLGEFSLGSDLMTGQQWRAGESIPGGRVVDAPAAWKAAKARIDAGKPGGATKVADYKNFILASQDDVLKRYSDRIDELKGKNLLPVPSSGVKDAYSSNKAYFVGSLKGVEKDMLTRSVQTLNGAVGTELRGDLHVVFVDSKAVDMSTEDYGNALMAYWQSPELKRDAIAKNSIVLIVGVEGYKKAAETVPVASPVDPTGITAAVPVDATPAPVIAAGTPVVAWAKAYTGMPLGNEAMLTQFKSDLPGTVIDANFVGEPTYNVKSGQITHTDGAVESILYGDNKFVRVSMSGADKDDSGSGFNYLSQDWKPSAGTMAVIFIISSILFAISMLLSVFGSASIAASTKTDPLRHLFTFTKGK